jgi:hypothetical protein
VKHLRTVVGPVALSTTISLVLLLAACGGSGVSGSESVGNATGAGGEGGGSGEGGRSSGKGGDDDKGSSGIVVGSSSSSSGGGVVCDSADDEDRDQDGYTRAGGDCNDCDANVNPDAIEVAITEPDPETGEIPEPADEDCDDLVDNVAPADCDAALALATTEGIEGARALDLCKDAPETGGWGVISARYVTADGTEVDPGAKAGILESFGPNVPPLAGARLLGLSSGHARLPGQEDDCNSGDCEAGGAGTAPPGFPAQAPGCEGGPGTPIFDDVALEVTLRAPSNATGYSFDFKFYTFEFSEWVCTQFNDQFVALADPAPPGAVGGNISFDASGNPVSVNIAFFDVCSSCQDFAANCLAGLDPDSGFCLGNNSCPSAPANCCSSGPAQLQGTGFDSWSSEFDTALVYDDFFGCSGVEPSAVKSGATSWLRTTAPVEPGSEVTLRFAIWDAGDQLLDSTAILDNFRWIANGGTVEIGTGETPDVPN